MANWRDGPEGRAKQYAERFDRVITKELGFGYDGNIHLADVKPGNIIFRE